MDTTQRQHEGYRNPARWNTVPVPARVAERAYTRVDVDENGCWISRYSTASHGYSQIGWQNRGARHVVLGHRAAWAHVHGQVPIGLTLDHTCRERRCVNPAHLRLMSNFENARRNTGTDFPMGQCVNGHPNTALVPTPRRTKAGEHRTGLTCGDCNGASERRTERPKKPRVERTFPKGQRPGRAVGESGYRGVSRSASKRNPWQATIRIAGEARRLGVFPTAEEAARAYDAAAVAHYGDLAARNIATRDAS